MSTIAPVKNAVTTEPAGLLFYMKHSRSPTPPTPSDDNIQVQGLSTLTAAMLPSTKAISSPEEHSKYVEGSLVGGGGVVVEEDNLNQESDDDNDNSSCSASELGYDLSISSSSGLHNNNNNNNNSKTISHPMHHPHPSSSPSSPSSSSRKNKRKNFKPRNILEYAGSDEEERHQHHQHVVTSSTPNHHHHNNNNTIIKSGESGGESRRLRYSQNVVSYEELSEDQIRSEEEEEDDEDEEEEEHSPHPRLSSSSGFPYPPHFPHPLAGLSNGGLGGHHHGLNMMMGGGGGGSDEEEGYNKRKSGGKGRRDNNEGPLDLSDSVQFAPRKGPTTNLRLPSTLTRIPTASKKGESSPNNNIHTLLGSSSDPMSFLNLNHSMASALAAAAGVNPFSGLSPAAFGMDLRLGGGNGRGDESRTSPEDPRGSTPTTPKGGGDHAAAAVLNDFAENTMKELLSLYGIAGGGGEGSMLRPGGKSSADPFNLHHDPISGQQSNKMPMLPENMARFLAAMQESVVSAAAAVAAGGRGDEGPTGYHHQPSKAALNFANINSLVQQQSSSGGSPSRHSPRDPVNVSSKANAINGSSSSSSPYNIHNHHHPQNLVRENSSGNSSSNINNNRESSGNGPLFSHRHKSRGLAAFPVIREGLLGKGAGPIDYTRYVRRFGNSMECGYSQCRELNYREHFHCQECSDGSRVFVKKEEMIRHFKWHKKRDESLQHGFMRYSPMDDCSDKFPNCSHNRKQTHYHCLKDGCEKVYISTSDVQMHANYHRKDSAIIQEGFQRFRAAEDCGSSHCTFRHQKTTHFHCRRPTCSFTFKNKADMEKHKSYHIKDEQLNRDGFKKFMKHEECQYPSCRFSRVCNHIHCIREGCNYVLHSSGQLYSHKRKHERRDAELAYRKYKLAQSLIKGNFGGDLNLGSPSSAFFDSLLSSSNKSEEEENSRSSFTESLRSNGGTPTTTTTTAVTPTGEAETEADRMKKSIQPCSCDSFPQDHFHCKVETCLNIPLAGPDEAGEHFKKHELEDRITALAYFTVDPANFDAQDSTIPCISAKCPYQSRDKHYHCLWDGCSEVILGSEESFKRYEHFKGHQLGPKFEFGGMAMISNGSVADEGDGLSMPQEEEGSGSGGQNGTIPGHDGFFRRKRGRPPKNRVIEVSSGGNEAIYTSFKLPKMGGPEGGTVGNGGGGGGPPVEDIGYGRKSEGELDKNVAFTSYPEGTPCHSDACPFKRALLLDEEEESSSSAHYHCGHPRCHFSVHDVHKLSSHLGEFHASCGGDLPSGFAYFDVGWDCGVKNCGFNGEKGHFHCTRDSFSCTSPTGMLAHDGDFHFEDQRREGSGGGSNSSNNSNDGDEDEEEDDDDDDGRRVVKSSGTFYPTRSSSNKVNGGSAMDLSNGPENLDMKPIVTDHSLSRILGAASGESSSSNSGETQYGPEAACGRPFCKLKRKAHFHCHLCNQAFSELEKLRPHVLKHSSISSPLNKPHHHHNHQSVSASPDSSSDQHSTDSEEVKNEQDSFNNNNDNDAPKRRANNKQPEASDNGVSPMGQQQHEGIPVSSPFPKFDLGMNMNLNMPHSPMGLGMGMNFPTPTSLSSFFQGYPGSPSPYLFLQQNPLLYAGMMFAGSPHGFPHPHGIPPPVGPPPPGLVGAPTIPTTATSSSVVTPTPSLSLPVELGGGPMPTSSSSGSSPLSVNKRPPSASPSSPASPSDAKKARMQMRILKDEPVPEGYIRFRFNEDCAYVHCGYREHQTHFHCTREDCGYSFCDKTRFVQHTARHERLDTLMGGDFKQFRANVSCGRPDCAYKNASGGTQAQNKASHFHCSKCDFVCTDTNKVVAHRRQHQKLDSIMAAGFEKFTPSQNCQIGKAKMDGCIHSQKQTHYHCLKCGYAVLGLSQMSAHKYRHCTSTGSGSGGHQLRPTEL